MKKEESNVIAQKLQKIPNGTLALKHCRAGRTGSALFGEQFRAVTAGKGCMEAYETFPGIEVSFNVFLASEVKFRHNASDSVLEIYYCRSGRVGWNMQDSLRPAYRHLYEGISGASGYEIITGNECHYCGYCFPCRLPNPGKVFKRFSVYSQNVTQRIQENPEYGSI